MSYIRYKTLVGSKARHATWKKTILIAIASGEHFYKLTTNVEVSCVLGISNEFIETSSKARGKGLRRLGLGPGAGGWGWGRGLG